MKNIIIIAIIVFSANAWAFDDWSDADIYRHAVFTGLKLIDFSQTLKIAREPEKYHELNPLLGSHPSERDVVVFFIGSYIAQTALVHVLPSQYRPWAQYVFIGVSGACVVNNFSIGLGVGF
jgi:hypothetical protein